MTQDINVATIVALCSVARTRILVVLDIGVVLKDILVAPISCVVEETIIVQELIVN